MTMRGMKRKENLQIQLLSGNIEEKYVNTFLCLHIPSNSLKMVRAHVVWLSLSVGVQQEDHDALLAEVKRLELELGKIRADLQGVLGCKGKCEQLDTLQETVSE